MIGPDVYVNTKATGGEMAGMPGMDGEKWHHTDQSSKESGPTTVLPFDGARIASTLQHAADVQKVGDKAFKGTIDVVEAAGALGLPESEVKKLPSTTVPFELTLDDQGRLAQYTLEMQATADAPARSMTLEFSGYGIPVEVAAPPAAEVEKRFGD